MPGCSMHSKPKLAEKLGITAYSKQSKQQQQQRKKTKVTSYVVVHGCYKI